MVGGIRRREEKRVKGEKVARKLETLTTAETVTVLDGKEDEVPVPFKSFMKITRYKFISSNIL